MHEHTKSVINRMSKGIGHLGAARTSAYYAVAPFIGAVLSLVIFRDVPKIRYFMALGFMIIGAWLSSSDEPIFKKYKS